MNLSMKTWVAKNKPDIIVVSYYIRENYSQQILQEALSSLKGEVAKIVLVENNPIFPDGNNFMVRRPILMTKYSPPPKFDISRMDYSNQHASDTLAKWAAQERISTLSLDKAFCDEASCLRFLDGDWLYRDVDHFSIRGAQRTIPYFRKLLVAP